MTFPRLKMQWTGEAFVPVGQFWQNIAAKNLVVGEWHWVAEDKERSKRSHNHFFVIVANGWAQLPEDWADMFPGRDNGPDLLRKYCLIRAGYHAVKDTVFETPEDARRAAALIDDRLDPERYTLADVRGCVVRKFIAESQSRAAMGNARFQQSKQDVLELIAGMIGISVEELCAHGKDEAA